jgi:hypothetical protein
MRASFLFPGTAFIAHAKNCQASGYRLVSADESSDGLLADARWILGLAREPASEAVVGFQITDLPLVGHGILQDADQAHSDRGPR